MNVDTISCMEGFKALFIERFENVDVSTDRSETLRRLKPYHDRAIVGAGLDPDCVCYAEQVHGAGIAQVGSADVGSTFPAVDGLITNEQGVGLGIYVADCGVLYLVDPESRLVGLLHSGKKGSELGITEKAIGIMKEEYGCCSKNIRAYLAPCIRPPAYEVDFAAQIRQQFLSSGGLEKNFNDSEVCTSSDRSRFYSYRVEKGKTGRMLAVLAIAKANPNDYE